MATTGGAYNLRGTPGEIVIRPSGGGTDALAFAPEARASLAAANLATTDIAALQSALTALTARVVTLEGRSGGSATDPVARAAAAAAQAAANAAQTTATTANSLAELANAWSLWNAEARASFYFQDFESGVMPADWSQSGAPTWNYTPALAGSFSLGIANGQDALYTLGSPLDEVLMSFLFKFNQLPPSDSEFLYFLNAGNDEILNLSLMPTSKVNIRVGSTNVQTVESILPNTLYRLWVAYKNLGAGANLGTVAFSTNTDLTAGRPKKGNAIAFRNDGPFTGAIDRVAFGKNFDPGGVYVFDNVYLLAP